jgi:RNA-directed DNA polymerase
LNSIAPILRGAPLGGESERTFLTFFTPVSRKRAYDPEWEPYIEERMGEKMLDHIKGYGQLVRLWYEQGGLCPICDQQITKESGWNIHHIIWRSKGGDDGMTNRALLHPECHRQVYSLKLKVDKPYRASGIGKA